MLKMEELGGGQQLSKICRASTSPFVFSGEKDLWSGIRTRSLRSCYPRSFPVARALMSVRTCFVRGVGSRET